MSRSTRSSAPDRRSMRRTQLPWTLGQEEIEDPTAGTGGKQNVSGTVEAIENVVISVTPTTISR
ncbi:MAG: hypothetical protein ACLR3S_02775 [Clostridium fessum]